MKLFRARNFQVLCVLMLMAFVGASLSMTSCKKKPKVVDDEESESKIDKNAVSSLGFYETYRFEEVANVISELAKAAASSETPDSTLLKCMEGYYGSPCVCNATMSEKLKINDIIEKYGKDILPDDLKLMWTLKSMDGKYQLIALKTKVSGKPAMTGESIIEAENLYDKYMGNVINVVLDKEGGKQFYRLTSENIGRSLAIVYKDKVCSYPTVNQPIEGGRIQITGNFTLEEAQELVNVLYGK